MPAPVATDLIAPRIRNDSPRKAVESTDETEASFDQALSDAIDQPVPTPRQSDESAEPAVAEVEPIDQEAAQVPESPGSDPSPPDDSGFPVSLEVFAGANQAVFVDEDSDLVIVHQADQTEPDEVEQPAQAKLNSIPPHAAATQSAPIEGHPPERIANQQVAIALEKVAAGPDDIQVPQSPNVVAAAKVASPPNAAESREPHSDSGENPSGQKSPEDPSAQKSPVPAQELPADQFEKPTRGERQLPDAGPRASATSSGPRQPFTPGASLLNSDPKPAPQAQTVSGARPPPPSRREVEFASTNHDRIVSAVRTQLLPRGGSMQIRLDPPNLGTVELAVRMQDGIMSVSIQTSSEEATRLLSHSLTQLKGVLESQGLSVDKLHVQQAPRDHDSARQDADQPRQNLQDETFARHEQQRKEMLRRMWRRLALGSDPLDLVA